MATSKHVYIMDNFCIYKGSTSGKVVRHDNPDVVRELLDSEVLVRITHSGICGTDEHYKHQNIVLGHEGVGIVKAVGHGVQQVKQYVQQWPLHMNSKELTRQTEETGLDGAIVMAAAGHVESAIGENNCSATAGSYMERPAYIKALSRLTPSGETNNSSTLSQTVYLLRWQHH